MTKESFINRLQKVEEYTPKNQISLPQEFLYKFLQKDDIYLKILETFD